MLAKNLEIDFNSLSLFPPKFLTIWYTSLQVGTGTVHNLYKNLQTHNTHTLANLQDPKAGRQ